MVNTIAIIFGVLGSIVAIWQRISCEKRLKSASQAETNTKLSKLFAELCWTANGRAGSQVSDKCIELLFDKGFIKKEDIDNKAIKQKIEENCILNLPIGLVSQEAAIISLGVLGNRYEIIYESARVALESLSKSMPEVLRGTIQKAQALLNGNR
jgi:hypothetical protein